MKIEKNGPVVKMQKGDLLLFKNGDWYFLEVFFDSKRFLLVNGRNEMELINHYEDVYSETLNPIIDFYKLKQDED